MHFVARIVLLRHNAPSSLPAAKGDPPSTEADVETAVSGVPHGEGSEHNKVTILCSALINGRKSREMKKLLLSLSWSRNYLRKATIGLSHGYNAKQGLWPLGVSWSGLWLELGSAFSSSFSSSNNAKDL